MSYIPKTWQCGDTITAEAMNHIEQGIANSNPFMVGVVEAEPPCAQRPDCTVETMDVILTATWQEIKDAADAGRNVYLQTTIAQILLSGIYVRDYYIVAFGELECDAESPTATVYAVHGSCDCGQN